MSMRHRWTAVLLLFALGAINLHAETIPYRIGAFPQEVAVMHGEASGLPSLDVKGLCLDENGRVCAVTAAGTALFNGAKWEKADVPSLQMAETCLAGKGLMEAARQWEAAGGKALPARQMAVSSKGALAAATSSGLFILNPGDKQPSPVVALDAVGRNWGGADMLGAAFDAQDRLWFASLAGVGCRSQENGKDTWAFYTGAEGLPYNDFTCAAAGPEGEVWFGTKLGAIRFEKGEWHYRQGRCWLPADEVRAMVVDAKGNAWFATPNGVGVIERRMMTLTQKADYYEDIMEKYIRRTPLGYVSEIRLNTPGTLEGGYVQSDSDNDGLWTAMYGAGECFAYAATKSPVAKDRATRAFEALRFLQKVTQGSPNEPPKGFVARTILPTDGPDPNEGRLEQDKKTQERDKLWKVYEPRWPKSADGKWYWKSDTSCDEIDGHYFLYAQYYELVAETEVEKERVREVVRDLTDHLISHDFTLVDHDGTVTRWGTYSPKDLNHVRAWWQERGMLSLSMLSYLAVAEHVTGDAKYGVEMKKLMEEESYDMNAMVFGVHSGPGTGNQSDDEMAFMSFYNLLKYAKDEGLKKMMLESFHTAWTVEQPEMNPLFNFAYAAHGLTAAEPQGDSRRRDSKEPWNGWLEDSMTTLKGFPLDRIEWGFKNSHRIDIVKYSRNVLANTTAKQAGRKGYRNNGKVLPVENRAFGHWNTDPWSLDYGGNGSTLASGTVYLLPYYMGLYHKFIEETK